MTLQLNLPTPEEPSEIKKMGFEVTDKSGRIENLRIFNKLYSYLWKEWKTILINHGIDDKTFRKILSAVKGEISEWVRDEKSWGELIESLHNVIYRMRSFRFI